MNTRDAMHLAPASGQSAVNRSLDQIVYMLAGRTGTPFFLTAGGGETP